MSHFFLESDNISSMRVVYIVVIALAVLACILPGIIRKFKLSKLDNADPQAAEDYKKLRINICPICGEKYLMTDDTKTVMDRPNRLISGTFYAAEYSNRYNKILTCSKCNYSIKIIHDHSETTDDAYRKVVEDTYLWTLAQNSFSSNEQKERIEKVLAYKIEKEKIDPKPY